MRGRIALCLVACSLACGDDQAFVGIPVDNAASSIAVVRSGDRHEIVALDLSDRAGVLDVAEVSRIDAVFPAETLEELGLQEGRLAPLDDGIQLPELPAFTLDEPAAGQAAWQTTASVIELEQRLRPHPDPCRTFSISWSRELDTRGDIGFLLPLGPQSHLISGYLRLFHLGGDVVSQVVTDPPDSWLSAYAQDDSGAYWFGGPGGELWQGELQGDPIPVGVTLTTATVTPARARILAMAHEPGSTTAVVVVDNLGKVTRWDGQRWTALWDFGVTQDNSTSMLRDDAGDVWLAGDNTQDILRIRNGVAEPSSPRTLMNGVPGLVQLPDFGVTVFSSAGEVFHRSGQLWELIQGSPVMVNVHAATRFSSGFIFAGVSGLIAQYRRPHSFCAEQRIASGTVRHMVPYGEDHLILMDGLATGPPTLQLLKSVF